MPIQYFRTLLLIVNILYSMEEKHETKNTAPAGRFCAVLAIIHIILHLGSCKPSTKRDESNNSLKIIDTVQTQADAINPNGTSELAALMRLLADFAETNRQRIENNHKPEPWGDEVNKLLRAQATDAEIKGPHYDAFAHDFIAATRRFNESVDNASESRLRHNAIVSACVSCHEQSCAGPMVRIKKLYVN